MAAVPYILSQPYLGANNFSYLTCNGVFTTGSPASGNLTRFSGAKTITNALANINFYGAPT